KGNGFVLSVRIFEVGKQRVRPNSEVGEVLETDRQSDVQAWAEGQACRALQVKCAGRIYVDADRRDMTIYIDNRLAPRSFKNPEAIAVEPGVHAVRVAVGQRTSLEKKVAVRRGGFWETVFARQTEKGGLPLTLASDLHGGRPDPSVDVQEGKWTRPVGYTLMVAAGLALCVGICRGRAAGSDVQRGRLLVFMQERRRRGGDVRRDELRAGGAEGHASQCADDMEFAVRSGDGDRGGGRHAKDGYDFAGHRLGGAQDR